MANHYLLLLVFVAAAEALSIYHRPIVVCDKPNEHLECGSPCQTECQSLGEPCNIASAICANACYCNQGFARNFTGECIPERECPPVRTCPNENERYQCSTACQVDCATYTMPCSNTNQECGCFCDSSYVRNAEGGCTSLFDCFLPQPTYSPEQLFNGNTKIY